MSRTAHKPRLRDARECLARRRREPEGRRRVCCVERGPSLFMIARGHIGAPRVGRSRPSAWHPTPRVRRRCSGSRWPTTSEVAEKRRSDRARDGDLFRRVHVIELQIGGIGPREELEALLGERPFNHPRVDLTRPARDQLQEQEIAVHRLRDRAATRHGSEDARMRRYMS